MSNRTNKKAPDNRGNNEEKELEMLLRSIWLSIRDDYRTLIEADLIKGIELGREYDDE